MLRQILVPLTLTLVAASAGAQSTSSAAASVRQLYFQQDFEAAVSASGKLVATRPNDLELRAWSIASRAALGQTEGHSGTPLAKAAVAAADSMIRRWPNSHWSHLARAMSRVYERNAGEDALKSAEKAHALAPRDPHAVWVYAHLLQVNRKFDETVALVDKRLSDFPSFSELQVVKARAMLAQSSSRSPDTLKQQQALAAYERARQLDPSSVNAHYLPGNWLLGSRRIDEAYPMLKRAIALTAAPGVHSAYWRAVMGLRNRSPEEKKAEVLADIEALRQVRGESPGGLKTIGNGYTQIEDWARLREVQDRILREYPTGVQSEWVLTERYRAIGDSVYNKKVADTIAAKTRIREALAAYVSRPSHVHEGLLGDAYLRLYHYASEDQNTPPDELLRIVQGTAKYNRINPSTTHSVAPALLGERTRFFREAEAIAKEGLGFAEQYVEDHKSAFPSVGEYADALDRLKSGMHDALGWIYFNEGRRAEARKQIERSIELSRENAAALYHLGRLEEQEGNLNEAETLYARGRAIETRGFAGKKSTEAIKTLYVKRHGSLDGYEVYESRLSELDRERRKEKIAASRIAKPDPAPGFALERMEGGRVTLQELKGKVVVVNYWGVWCGPCVKETPEIQKFYEKYKNDPDVVFVTIDNDANPDTVRDWMKAKKYDFPVLLDDGYVRKAGVTAFPTTWFIDRAGNIVFTHKGASDVVVEEFSWRVDLLKAGVKPATN